jgi:DNA-binding response OmpR family regulator
MSTEILFVDADPHIQNTLAPYLSDANFIATFVHDGQVAIKKALNQNFSAIILDLIPLHIDGFHIVKLIRKHSAVPILMQSNCDDDLARILSLEYGADDYLIKPYNPLELISRIKAILRRTPNTSHPTMLITHNNLTLDLKSRQALLDGKELELTNTEFNILVVLMKSPGHVFSKSELTEYALGKTYTVHDRSIDVHISHLRTKLTSEWIKTVHGYGYLLQDHGSST